MISPKISIVTASFNSEKTIADTLESVLNQVYKNIEYLIIDGGSTDKTIQIIKSFEDRFNGRLSWISEPDGGIYDAWNKALKLFTGDWISFVGSDDILLDNAISDYVSAMNTDSQLNFISSNVLLVKQNLEPIRLIGKPWSKKIRSYNCIAHVGCQHHKSLFAHTGTFNSDYRIVGDYDFLLRCEDIIRPHYMSITTAKVREAGISGRNILRVAKEVLKTKITNKSQPTFICYIRYMIMLLKYFIRKNVINRLSMFTVNVKNINGI